jgi:hypothetical protein
MNGLNRSTSARRGRGHLPAASVVAVVAAVGLLAAPGTASAAPTAASTGPVTPLLDCVIKHQNTSGWTAVLGYANSSKGPVSYAVGPDNVLTPAQRNGEQPTRFQAGSHPGDFTVEFQTGNSVTWTVAGQSVTATMYSKTCPSSTELPEDGNGTGPAIALVAAGVVGAVAVQRVRRRASAAAGVPAGAGRDDDA